MGDNQKKSSRQMSTSLERNKELTGAFNEGGKDIEKRRDRANNAKEKIIYFKQLIRVVLTDTLGNIVPRCDFLITTDNNIILMEINDKVGYKCQSMDTTFKLSKLYFDTLIKNIFKPILNNKLITDEEWIYTAKLV